jgi:putative transposase
MQRLQAYRFALQPNGEQERQMRRFAGACRFVFNKALALHLAERSNGGRKTSGYAALCRQLTTWRNDPTTPWMAAAPVHTQQQALKNLEAGWTAHFASLKKLKAGLIRPSEVVQPPTFKKKGRSHDSFRYPDAKQFRLEQANRRVCLPKLGWLRYRKSRDVLGEVSNITIGASGGRWFVSLQTEREVEQPVHPATGIVGIDVGITRFATLSDATFIAPLSSFKQHQQRLARYQRAMARKTKFSNNWKKAKARVTTIHSRIANVRKDFLHKTTTTISKNHAIVCIEDLQVRNMSTSAAGSSEKPGRNVRAKAGLNRAILDQGWSEFRRQLHYKQAWRGGWVIAVPPQNTSRTCPACTQVSAENRRSQARFECVACGYANNADVVGAINVLERGHRLLARGEPARSGRSAKQEPTEATQALPA